LLHILEYKLSYYPQFEKSVKKIAKKDKELGQEILEQISLILKDPHSFDKLKGNLKEFNSCHFHRSPEYRILFKVYHCSIIDKKGNAVCEINEDDCPETCKGMIDLIFVETRETFNRLYKMNNKQLGYFVR
jgi:mRNA-degrading endonuclease YafQ of YafQ-DinJ toxin-antitoxin module